MFLTLSKLLSLLWSLEKVSLCVGSLRGTPQPPAASGSSQIQSLMVSTARCYEEFSFLHPPAQTGVTPSALTSHLDSSTRSWYGPRCPWGVLLAFPFWAYRIPGPPLLASSPWGHSPQATCFMLGAWSYKKTVQSHPQDKGPSWASKPLYSVRITDRVCT